VRNSLDSLLLKLICESSGCELDIEKKARTSMLAFNKDKHKMK
jgi:hypothetical protein